MQHASSPAVNCCDLACTAVLSSALAVPVELLTPFALAHPPLQLFPLTRALKLKKSSGKADNDASLKRIAAAILQLADGVAA